MRLPTQSWTRFRKVETGARLMDEVMERLGIDAAASIRDSAGEEFAAARSNCASCRHAVACRRWLDASIVMSAPPPFCPNRDFYCQFRAVDAGVLRVAH
ncbi:MAG: DUF6455 family protein [Hyphomicrobiaceae bacterium]